MHKMLANSAIVNGALSPAKQSESTSIDESKKVEDQSSEVETLKSTLAMVAALAQQAHDATLQERTESEEKIKTLENKLRFYEVE